MDSSPITLQELEDERYRAMLDGDIGRLEELCHDDLAYAHSNASRDTKASYLKKVADGVFKYHSIEHPVERITVVGDTAVVVGAMKADVDMAGVRKQIDNSSLAVWVRQGDTWRLLAYQPTPFAK